MKRTITALAAAVAVLCLTAGPALAKQPAAAAEPAGTIVDLAVGASSLEGPDANGKDYDLLVAAVLATGLDDALAGDTALTVFAPNDRAFQRLVADLTGAEELPSEADALAAVLATFSPAQITAILLYHVTPGALDSGAVLSSGALTMLDGGTVTPASPFRLVDETLALKDPKLVRQGIDLVAANGVIHTIDRVLVPTL
ncbi:MAG TPA: fasciclin domain-containing protein [Solirubrobacteraceae bacterium]|nr:fasciclin domain-containing protein [Solirubrobacteraceae bacterium]